MNPAIKKRVTAIIKGCALCKPILVAADADAHRIAKQIPAVSSLILLGLLFFNEIKSKF